MSNHLPVASSGGFGDWSQTSWMGSTLPTPMTNSYPSHTNSFASSRTNSTMSEMLQPNMANIASRGQNYTMDCGLPISQDSSFNFMAVRPINSASVYNNTLVNPAFNQAAEAARTVHGAWMNNDHDFSHSITGMNNNGYTGLDNNYSTDSYQAPENVENVNIFDTINFDACKCTRCDILKL